MYSDLLFYLAFYSFLGWCIETIYKTITEKRFVNSGFLYGPFCPIYGFGAIIMILCLSKIKNNILAVFLASTFLLTVWEYIVGVLLEKIFKTKYWDYSHLKFNINGRVCLKNSIYWGILGVIFTFLVHSFVQNQVEMINDNILIRINIIIYVIFITDVIISVTKTLLMDKNIEKLNEITEKIKEKVNELKTQKKNGKDYTESMALDISNLKEKQSKLKMKIYKLIVRLKSAFPTMKSETISKFISQKIDIKNIRNKMRKNKGE